MVGGSQQLRPARSGRGVIAGGSGRITGGSGTLTPQSTPKPPTLEELRRMRQTGKAMTSEELQLLKAAEETGGERGGQGRGSLAGPRSLETWLACQAAAT